MAATTCCGVLVAPLLPMAGRTGAADDEELLDAGPDPAPDEPPPQPDTPVTKINATAAAMEVCDLFIAFHSLVCVY
jgi:hypothetical protein